MMSRTSNKINNKVIKKASVTKSKASVQKLKSTQLKDNRLLHLIILLSVLSIVGYYYRETLKINIFTFFIVKRGIITGFPFWWRLSEIFLKDASGVNLMYELKEKYQTPIVDVNLFGTPMGCVLDINLIKEILDNSPYIFEVGTMKYQMFETFMKDNVGVSGGKEWERRRKLNEIALSTGSLHPKSSNYHQIIGEGLNMFEMKI